MAQLLLLLFSVSTPASPTIVDGQRKPNFVILFADDMGYSQPSAVSDLSGWVVCGSICTLVVPSSCPLSQNTHMHIFSCRRSPSGRWRSRFAGDNGTILIPNLDRLAAEGIAFTSWYSGFHGGCPPHTRTSAESP